MTEHALFRSPADHYDRFMGRYTPSLAAALLDAAAIEPGMRVLDVGCGPGGLTAALAARTSPQLVAAVDPAEQFAAACGERVPGADVRVGFAEELPWGDGVFDAALSCLVIAFMRDADAGTREMARVTRHGGVVASCMWDLEHGGMTMLRIFWRAMREVRPDVEGERDRPGTSEGDIAERFERAGLRDVVAGTLDAHADYAGFEDFWQPFTLAVGPAGNAFATLHPDEQAAVREACRRAVSDEPFTLSARAWYATGIVADPSTLRASGSRG